MRRFSTLSVLLFGGLFLAACGGGEQESADMASSSQDMAASASSDALSCYIANATMAEAQERPSPLQSVELSVGGNDALLCYGAPSARGRVVMGELVPFGEPWRLGANEATAIHLSGPATLGGVALEPGSYSLYAVPGEAEWQFFINTNAERWGIPIDASVRSSEVGSFTVEPATTDGMVETLTFHFEPNAEGTMGDIVMEWENTQATFHLHPAM
ncbi:MAG: DUF2911 domain-containing protein [Longimicrobiales bacterium]|nr:DUF2911 domain-containing protein [Longimicrobiales bacterium]